MAKTARVGWAKPTLWLRVQTRPKTAFVPMECCKKTNEACSNTMAVTWGWVQRVETPSLFKHNEACSNTKVVQGNQQNLPKHEGGVSVTATTTAWAWLCETQRRGSGTMPVTTTAWGCLWESEHGGSGRSKKVGLREIDEREKRRLLSL